MHVPLSSQIQGENRQARSVRKQTSFRLWLQAVCVTQSPAKAQVGLTPCEGTGPHAACSRCDQAPGLPLFLPIVCCLQIARRRPVRLASLHCTAWLGRVVDAWTLLEQLRRPSKLCPLPGGPTALLIDELRRHLSPSDFVNCRQKAACVGGGLEPCLFG